MSRESDRCTGCRHQAADDITGCLRQDCSESWPVQKLRAENKTLHARIEKLEVALRYFSQMIPREALEHIEWKAAQAGR